MFADLLLLEVRYQRRECKRLRNEENKIRVWREAQKRAPLQKEADIGIKLEKKEKKNQARKSV
jgi:hypothetical protein